MADFSTLCTPWGKGVLRSQEINESSINALVQSDIVNEECTPSA